MLKIEKLSVFYGGIHALRGVNIEVADGKIITLIGANGAGKSTILNSIVGLVKSSDGIVEWNGENIIGCKTKDIVSMGLVLVPEGRRIFPNLSVDENLRLGAYFRKDKTGIRTDRERCLTLFPRLKERLRQSAGTLSGGEQQMLAVARGLMSNPKLLMLDEPSLGLAPIVSKIIFDVIREINRNGATVLLIEQNARAALEIADYAYVLETGAVAIQGKGDALLNDDNVRKAYLGEG
ncbi:MAG: ABC transporter ATP-binding protein [Treponema sp.]|jgi:branched-chain amino acid transport system ATP-binding protein|nr:ABC transporter ATP-binding protein [Treponema sp.]MDR1216125.1 ABC transporter ATP-binding protein [Treponema sp.]